MKKFAILVALAAFCMGAQAQDKLYTVKSGIVTMEMDMMGQPMVQEVYFDDYGAKQVTVSYFGGQKMRMLVIDGKNVMVNDNEKTAMSMPGGMPGGSQEKINFSNLTEKDIKKNKIKELGKETVAGKECTKYSVSVFMMGQVMKQTVWVYKGITLKTSMKTDFGDMGQTATKIVEDVEIPATMFELPEGVKVQEMDMSRMMGGGF